MKIFALMLLAFVLSLGLAPAGAQTGCDKTRESCR